MTSKELLREFVNHLNESDAAEALGVLRQRYDVSNVKRPRRQLPSCVGVGRSGEKDLGKRAKEILRAEWGQGGSRQ